MPITISGNGTMGTMASGGITGGATLTQGTAATASGTSVDFTGIPSWAKRVTVLLSGVSTNGASDPLIRIGSGSIAATGYLTATSSLGNTVVTTNNTTGFGIYYTGGWGATVVLSGRLVFELLNSTTNTWVGNGVMNRSDGANTCPISGYISLAGALDRVRITTTNGTDTFDAGSINILYE